VRQEFRLFSAGHHGRDGILMHDIPVFRQSFFFLRHGESTANVARIVGGTLDVELTTRGHEQARSVQGTDCRLRR